MLYLLLSHVSQFSANVVVHLGPVVISLSQGQPNQLQIHSRRLRLPELRRQDLRTRQRETVPRGHQRRM